jgi:hypothetical protein
MQQRLRALGLKIIIHRTHEPVHKQSRPPACAYLTLLLCVAHVNRHRSVTMWRS